MTTLRSVSALLVATTMVATAALAQLPAVVPAPLPNPSPIPIATAPPPLAPQAPFTSAPIPAAPAPLGTAPFPPPPGPTTTLASFLGMSYAQREYRQRRIARTPAGELRSKIQTPLSKLTGGLIPPFPPETPSLAELMAPGPVGAAAKAKLDRQTAKDRIQAVKYLGTLDCHYWPEAEDALIEALRVDRNEWVRIAAAQTLGKGCCCTKKTMAALSMVVCCSNADGNPVEKSPQVIAAAQSALQRCLAMNPSAPPIGMPVVADPQVQTGPTDEPRDRPPTDAGAMQAAYAKPAPAGEEKGAGGLAAGQVARPTGKEWYNRVAKGTWPQVIQMAHQALAASPPIPVEYLGDTDPGGDPSDARVHSPPPANLLDYLTGNGSRGQPAGGTMTAQHVSHTPVARPEQRPAMMASVPAATPTREPAPSVPAAVPARPVVASALPPAAPAKQPAPTVPAAKPQPVAPVASVPPAVPSRPPITPAAPAAPVSTATAAPKAPVLQPVPPASPTPVPPAPAQPAAARPMPVQAAKVMVLFVQQTDPRELEREIDQLSATDLTGEKSIVPVLLRSAEDGSDPGVRAACVRALVRGKANTPAVLEGLERLVNDRSVDVRIEAAVGLNELKK